MTEERYEERRAIIMAKIYSLSETFADRRPKFPRSLKAAMRELDKLEKEWISEKQ